jgi:hypothetical protein
VIENRLVSADLVDFDFERGVFERCANAATNTIATINYGAVQDSGLV